MYADMVLEIDQQAKGYTAFPNDLPWQPAKDKFDEQTHA
jgi:hypothetical protein